MCSPPPEPFLRDPIRFAVVLAAGRGTRMGVLTEDVPKPMLHVRGKPMLEIVVERMLAAGVDRLLLVVGYRREVITDHFAGWGSRISFVVQEHSSGTGSAAKLASEFAGHSPFLLTFGDILCEAHEYEECGAVLLEHPATAAVLGVRHLEDPWRGAAVYERDGLVTRVVEKPPKGTSQTHWGSAGLYAFRPVVFGYLERVQPSVRNEYELTSVFDMMIADGLEVRMSPIEGPWRDVGRPEDIEAANRELSGSSPEPANH